MHVEMNHIQIFYVSDAACLHANERTFLIHSCVFLKNDSDPAFDMWVPASRHLCKSLAHCISWILVGGRNSAMALSTRITTLLNIR